MKALYIILFVFFSCNSSKKLVSKSSYDSTSVVSKTNAHGSLKDSTKVSTEAKEWFTKTVIQYDTIRIKDSIYFRPKTKVIYESGRSFKTDSVRLYVHDTITIKEAAKTEVSKKEVDKSIEKKKTPWLLIIAFFAALIFIAKTVISRF